MSGLSCRPGKASSSGWRAKSARLARRAARSARLACRAARSFMEARFTGNSPTCHDAGMSLAFAKCPWLRLGYQHLIRCHRSVIKDRSAGGAGKMARILLAEDDEEMRAFLAHCLRRAGHDVSATEDGESAAS